MPFRAGVSRLTESSNNSQRQGVAAARIVRANMLFDRTLMWSSVATRHLLESRLHMLAAVEAMADMEGLRAEHEKAVQLRHGLDEVFLAVEDKTLELMRRLKDGGS